MNIRIRLNSLIKGFKDKRTSTGTKKVLPTTCNKPVLPPLPKKKMEM